MQELFSWFWCFPNCLLRSFRSFEWLLMCGYYCLITIDWRSVTSRTIRSYECESSSSTVQASSDFDHIPFIPSFYALVALSNIAWVGLDNMWVLGSSWWGRTYCPVYYQTLGSCFYVMLILPCYARRRGLGLSEFSMTDVRLLINGST